MTSSIENQDETEYLLGNPANAEHLRKSLRQLQAGQVKSSLEREGLVRNAFSRSKRAAESVIARNLHRLRVAREGWQKAVDEGR